MAGSRCEPKSSSFSELPGLKPEPPRMHNAENTRPWGNPETNWTDQLDNFKPLFAEKLIKKT